MPNTKKKSKSHENVFSKPDSNPGWAAHIQEVEKKNSGGKNKEIG